MIVNSNFTITFSVLIVILDYWSVHQNILGRELVLFKLYLRSGSFSFIPQETVSPTVLEYKSLPVGHIIQFYESQSLYSNAEEGLSFKQSVSFLFKPVSKTE